LLQRLAASGRTHDASIDEELARDRQAALCGAVNCLLDPVAYGQRLQSGPRWLVRRRTSRRVALVLLHLEHDRPLPGGYAKLRLVTRKSSVRT